MKINILSVIEAPVVLVHLLEEVTAHPRKVLGLGYSEEILDRLVQAALAAFEAQHLVAAFANDLRGDRAPTAHGIEGADRRSQAVSNRQCRG